MKPNTGKYLEVATLPKTAKTVKAYANEKDISTAYVYKLIKQGKNTFKIVLFQGVNFIIP